MEMIRQPRLACPLAIRLAIGLMVAMVIGTNLLVWRPRTADLLCAEPTPPPSSSAAAKPSAEATGDSRYVQARKRMVEADLRGRDITDAKVLEVMGRLPRHQFVPKDLRGVVYADVPLPIGHGQTISQPYIVALTTQAVRPGPKSRALDIGTGSGYQAAVLGELCKKVYSIEILKPLADSAQKRLAEMGYRNITVRTGDPSRPDCSSRWGVDLGSLNGLAPPRREG